VDFWALGVLLWELTTGQPLFGGEGQDDVATYRSISEFSPASLKLPDGVSTDLRAFLQGLLTPDPDARWVGGFVGDPTRPLDLFVCDLTRAKLWWLFSG
jgi:serine/threonine protein kinase